MFKRPLICTDFEDGLERLAHLVPALAESGMRSPTFLHVIPFDSGYEMPREDKEKVEAAKAKLSPALEAAQDDITPAIEVRTGRIQETIQSVAEKYDCDVVILGGSSHTLLTERLFGSTTIALAQKVQYPLMILRPAFIATLTTEELETRCRNLCRTVLLPFSGSSNSKSLLKQFEAICEADRTDGDDYIGCDRCILLQVVNEVARGIPTDDLVSEAKDSLKAAAQPMEKMGLRVDTEVEVGEFVTTLLKYARTKDISAIAIRSKKRNRLLELSVPSKTSKVLRSSLHPLLYFPAP